MKNSSFRTTSLGLFALFLNTTSCSSSPVANPEASSSSGGASNTSGVVRGDGGSMGAVGNSGGSSDPSNGSSGGLGSGGPAGGAGGVTSGNDTGGTASGGSSAVVVQRPALVTSGEGAYWKEAPLTMGQGGTATITVNDAKAFQNWLGMGGTFNEAGWDALSVLSAADIDQAIQLLYGANEGANFAWGRLPIGASDYAMSRYTLNETANDYEMQSFSIERDRQMLIPYIHAALAVKPDIKFWGSPWTPPSWMKTPASIDGTDQGGTFKAKMKSDSDVLKAYALYFAKYIEEYAKEGIKLDHIHPQNEPGYSTRYPSCLWDKGLLGTFVGDYLGPTLAEHNLDTQIWFGTLSNADTYADQISGLSGKAKDYVVGVGLQWNTMPNVQTLANQGYLILQTEHKCGNYPFGDAAQAAKFNSDHPPNDHEYGVESWGLIRDWIKAGVNAYSAWNMVLDTKGQNLDEYRTWPQNALLVVDRDTKTLTATPAYYVFRHISYFVDPGATRIETTGGDALAFKNPNGSIIVIMYNSAAQPAQTTLAIAGSSAQFQIPAQGWATVNWEG